MTFAIVDGDAASGRARAVPHHWLWAVVALIIAEWVLQNVSQLVVLSVRTAVLPPVDDGILGMMSQVDRLASRGISWRALEGVARALSETIAYATIATLALVYALQFDRRNGLSLGLNRRVFARSLPWIVVGLAAASPLLFLVEPIDTRLLQHAGALVAFLTPLVVIQAGAEEILFRGLIMTSLVARYGAARGILISALIFALWHVYVSQPMPDAIFAAVTTFIFGVTSSLLVLKQGHLGGAIALHVVWNVSSGVVSALQTSAVYLTVADTFWALVNVYFMHAPRLEMWDVWVMNQMLIPLLIETVIVLVATHAIIRPMVAAR